MRRIRRVGPGRGFCRRRRRRFVGSRSRSRVLNLAKTCSIGLRSGEYLGKKTRRAPTLRIAFRTAFPLWEPRLSRIRQGAMRSLRKAARKVAVFHLPCGTLWTSRSPLGAQSRGRVLLGPSARGIVGACPLPQGRRSHHGANSWLTAFVGQQGATQCVVIEFVGLRTPPPARHDNRRWIDESRTLSELRRSARGRAAGNTSVFARMRADRPSKSRFRSYQRQDRCSY